MNDTTCLNKNLNIYYEKAHGTVDSEKYKKLFFDSFPSNFEEFNSLYGYGDKLGPMKLYNMYEKHMNFFCSLNYLEPNSIFFHKLIKLGINGHWEADAVNSLQECLLHHFIDESALAVSKLREFKSVEIKSFWRFIFDGPHPDDQGVKIQFDQLYKNIIVLDKPMAKTMKKEYLRLIKESDKHGK